MSVPDEKECPRCGGTKPADEFHQRSGDGTQRLNSYCKSCSAAASREYDKQVYEQEEEWLAEYKTERGCDRCGFDDHPAALDTYHPEGVETPQNGQALVSKYSHNDFRTEARKCRVLCANCRRILSNKN